MTEISKVYPPHISFTNPLSILSRQNLKIGWALLWRGVMAPYGLLYGIVKVFPDLETIIGKDLFGFSAFCLMVFSLVYFARKVALKEYGVVLSGILWPFLWRILIALYSIVLFSVFELAAMGQAGSLVGAVVTLLGAGLVLLGAAGWALHRQMEIPAATNSSQVAGIIFATVVFAWIIYLNHDREGRDIHGYTAKESNLMDTKRDSRESSNQAANISKTKIVDFEQDKALQFGWNTALVGRV